MDAVPRPASGCRLVLIQKKQDSDSLPHTWPSVSSLSAARLAVNLSVTAPTVKIRELADQVKRGIPWAEKNKQTALAATATHRHTPRHMPLIRHSQLRLSS